MSHSEQNKDVHNKKRSWSHNQSRRTPPSSEDEGYTPTHSEHTRPSSRHRVEEGTPDMEELEAAMFVVNQFLQKQKEKSDKKASSSGPPRSSSKSMAPRPSPRVTRAHVNLEGEAVSRPRFVERSLPKGQDFDKRS